MRRELHSSEIEAFRSTLDRLLNVSSVAEAKAASDFYFEQSQSVQGAVGRHISNTIKQTPALASKYAVALGLVSELVERIHTPLVETRPRRQVGLRRED